jgi:hypothetical protein
MKSILFSSYRFFNMRKITGLVILSFVILLAIAVIPPFYDPLNHGNICYNIACMTGLVSESIVQYVAAQEEEEVEEEEVEEEEVEEVEPEESEGGPRYTPPPSQRSEPSPPASPLPPYTPPPSSPSSPSSPSPYTPPYTPPPSSPNFATYLNPNFRIRIQYPISWQIVEYPDHIVFTSPTESASDRYTETLEVYVLNSDTTLLSGSITQRINNYRGSLPDFILIGSNPTTLADAPAYVIEYNFNDPSMGLARAKEIVTRNGNNEYTILYTAKSEDYLKNNFNINRMITSFQITR